MHSPQLGSIAIKGAHAFIPRNPKRPAHDGWFIAREFFQNGDVGFADILALLAPKTIGESDCSAAGAITHRSRRRTKLRYTTLQSSAHTRSVQARTLQDCGFQNETKKQIKWLRQAR
jgi:hypothetical protein